MEEKQDFDLETEKGFQALQVCFHYKYFFNQILDNVESTTQFIIRIQENKKEMKESSFPQHFEFEVKVIVFSTFEIS